MSSNLLLFSPKIKALDVKGAPISGAKLYVYLAGTSIKSVSYKENSLQTAHSNPVISNNFGDFPAIYLGKDVYKLVLCDDVDNVLWTLDEVDLNDENSYLVTQDTDGNIVIENTSVNKDIVFKTTNTDYPNGGEVARISSSNMTLKYNPELDIEERISNDDEIPNVLWTKNKVAEASPYNFQSGFDMTVNADLVNIAISPGNGTIENVSGAGNFISLSTISKDISLAWAPETQAAVCCPISGPYDVSEEPFYVSFTETSEVVEGETVYHTAATLRATTKLSFPNGLEDTNKTGIIYTLDSDFSPVEWQDIADGYYNLWVTFDGVSTLTGHITATDPIYLANVPGSFEDDTFYYISSINKTFVGSTETHGMYLGWFTIENGRKIRSRFTDYGKREDICTKLITKRPYTSTGTNTYTAPTNFKYATVIAIGGGGGAYKRFSHNTTKYEITSGGGGGAICRDILYDISSVTFTVGAAGSASTFGDMIASAGANGSSGIPGTYGAGGIAYNTRAFTGNYYGVNGVDGSIGAVTVSASLKAGAGGKADYATLAANVGTDELSGYGTGLGGAAVSGNTATSYAGSVYGGAHSGECSHSNRIISSTHPPYLLTGAQGFVLIVEVA